MRFFLIFLSCVALHAELTEDSYSDEPLAEEEVEAAVLPLEEDQVEAAADSPEDKEEEQESNREESPPSPWVRYARCLPEKRWYFEFKPGYYYFTDSNMRTFFDNGGFTIRAETGYQFWGPLMVWVDAGYFQKSGSAIGGLEPLEIKLASITLGLKALYQFNPYIAAYAGAGPRLCMMLLHNGSPFVRGEDNEVGIGGGFNAGFWLFPIPQWWPSLFLDLFTDYTLKTMHVQPDEISSIDNDVVISGFTFGLGLGIRF